MSISAGEIAEFVSGRQCVALTSDQADLAIVDGQSLENAGPQHVTFLESEAYFSRLSSCDAAAILTTPKLSARICEEHKFAVVVEVDDPQGAFLKLLMHFRPPRTRAEVGVSSLAYVSPTASIGDDTNIHPGAYVGDDVIVGSHCEIYPGTYIGHGSILGDHVTVQPNCSIYDDTRIGDHVVLHASAVVGTDGFGYRFKNGRHEKIPHLGTARIEDHVEIGSGTTIDRAMVGETVIGAGTKLDNQVQIAHNCEVGEHNVFASQVGMAGSSTTGAYVAAGGQAGIADHVNVGSQVMLASRCAANRDLPSNQAYGGGPCQPIKEWGRSVATYKQLPQMRSTMRELVKQVGTLTNQISELEQKIESLSDAESRNAA